MPLNVSFLVSRLQKPPGDNRPSLRRGAADWQTANSRPRARWGKPSSKTLVNIRSFWNLVASIVAIGQHGWIKDALEISGAAGYDDQIAERYEMRAVKIRSE